jgi:integrase
LEHCYIRPHTTTSPADVITAAVAELTTRPPATRSALSHSRAQEAAERLQRDAECDPDLGSAGELLDLARHLVTATPHTLRHSLARRMIERCADLGEVQRVLGHSNIATTGRYVTPSEDDLREAIGRAGV